MFSAKSLIQDLVHLIYPHLCAGCGSDLLKSDALLCIYCRNELPHTGFASLENNLTEKIFTGRIHLNAAHSEFYFAKGKMIQHLIHELKYNGNREIGHQLGKITGESLSKSGRFNHIDAIIPLPMFRKKEFKRGYNQATIIAQGISASLNAPVMEHIVIRSKATETQTRKHRSERWLNVAESFHITNKDLLKGKNILLTDDVITTGASLEACGQAILDIPDTNLSIATVAIASK